MKYGICRETLIYKHEYAEFVTESEYLTEHEDTGKGVWDTNFNKAYTGFGSVVDAFKYLRWIITEGDVDRNFYVWKVEDL